MIEEKNHSVYILPIRNGKVAFLRYGNNGYGAIGGRLKSGENFKTALRRETSEELGEKALKMLDLTTEIPVTYSFHHSTLEQAEKRGAWNEEHHFFITHETNNLDLTFIEKRNENISLVWLDISDLNNSKIIQFDDERKFFTEHIIPNIKCRFSMSVRHTYFEMIKTGQKDIELRAYDNKRKKVNIGDKFLLFDTENQNEYIICEVLNMHIAPNFKTLFKNIDIKRSGFKNINDLMNTITKFVSKEELSREQIVGMEIKRTK